MPKAVLSPFFLSLVFVCFFICLLVFMQACACLCVCKGGGALEVGDGDRDMADSKGVVESGNWLDRNDCADSNHSILLPRICHDGIRMWVLDLIKMCPGTRHVCIQKGLLESFNLCSRICHFGIQIETGVPYFSCPEIDHFSFRPDSPMFLMHGVVYCTVTGG